MGKYVIELKGSDFADQIGRKIVFGGKVLTITEVMVEGEAIGREIIMKAIERGNMKSKN